MTQQEWKEYIQAETQQINRFIDRESKKQGLNISSNDACIMWIQTQADKFCLGWLKKNKNNGSAASCKI